MRGDSSAAASAGTLSAFQRLCILTCAVIFGLIVLGGVVRASDSGLGCPAWPRCHGSLVPRWEKHTLIEYSHRLTASVAGLLVLAVAVAAWRAYRRVPAGLYPATLSLALMLVGAYVAGAGYGLACSGWPLCNDAVVPGARAASVQFHFAHRLLALALGL